MKTLEDNDIALVIKPNIKDGSWAGTVDINILTMPSPDLSQEAADDLLYLVNGLVACFNLMNTDEVFANRVSVYMEVMKKKDDQAKSIRPTDASGNVIDFNQWTKTKGNA